MTRAQRAAIESLWPRFGLECRGILDLDAAFGRRAGRVMEIGFGNGEALLALARSHPERNWLGVEVHRPGVGHLLLRLEELELTNVRVLRQDGMDVLRHQLGAASLDGLQLFFPDPWHKKRHHKRRILQVPLLDTLARVIRPGGFLHAATDWEDYAQQMMAVLSADQARFENIAGTGNYTPRPAERPLTKFERRGQRLGHGVWDLIFTRRP